MEQSNTDNKNSDDSVSQRVYFSKPCWLLEEKRSWWIWCGENDGASVTRQEGKKRLFCWYARDGGGVVII